MIISCDLPLIEINTMTQIQLLAQILPLLVFIVVDSIWNDVKISIVSAIVLLLSNYFYFYYKTGQFAGLFLLIWL